MSILGVVCRLKLKIGPKLMNPLFLEFLSLDRGYTNNMNGRNDFPKTFDFDPPFGHITDSFTN